MVNRFEIPDEVETRLRRVFRICAYCRRRMKSHLGVSGCPADKATIEHLNRQGPFYWSEGLREEHLVIACGQCNASRGIKRLKDWFQSDYCLSRGIGPSTVAPRVRDYLRAAVARR